MWSCHLPASGAPADLQPAALPSKAMAGWMAHEKALLPGHCCAPGKLSVCPCLHKRMLQHGHGLSSFRCRACFTHSCKLRVSQRAGAGIGIQRQARGTMMQPLSKSSGGGMGSAWQHGSQHPLPGLRVLQLRRAHTLLQSLLQSLVAALLVLPLPWPPPAL